MERSYRYLPLFLIMLLGVLIGGFYKTYFQFFPVFDGFSWVQHFHGILMLIWFLMLLVQPWLVRKKKLRYHRLIGKLSYLVIPLLLASIFLISRENYYKLLQNESAYAALESIALNIPNLLAFAFFYILSIYHKRRAGSHMRYMIGTAILMIGPGLGRVLIIYFDMPFAFTIHAVNYFMIAISLLLLLMDIRNKKSYIPYTTILAVLAMIQLCWIVREATWWQFLANRVADYWYR